MKTKKLLLSTVIVLLFCTFLICAVGFTMAPKKAHAEEIVNEEVVNEPSEGESNDRIDDLTAKINEYLYTTKSTWDTKILPLIISSAISAVVSGVLSVIFGKGLRKWKGRYNQCASAYNELEVKTKEYKDIIDKHNLSGEIAELSNKIDRNHKEILETKDLTSKINDTVSNIKSGALQAWAECPDAIRGLTNISEVKKNETDDEA